MKRIIDLLREPVINSLDPCQVINPCPGNFPQSPQLLQQLLAPLRANAGYFFQWRGTPGLCTALSVTGNRKPVCLVPDLLYQVQRR
jgi:hypothetical protein